MQLYRFQEIVNRARYLIEHYRFDIHTAISISIQELEEKGDDWNE